MPKIVHQDDNLLLVRKPHGIASSWGQEECFLDNVKKYGSDFCESTSLRGTKQSIEDVQIRKNQISTFGEDGEYGLLNRLDNVTAWLLYFARSPEAKEEYTVLQEQGKVIKTYYAQVYGTPRAQFGRISTPIYHYCDDASRMTIDPEKGRWKPQEVTTYWERTSQESILKIHITSGCRHQIRCHLASIGYPIIGDRLYMSKWLKKQYPEFDQNKIELVSAGLDF